MINIENLNLQYITDKKGEKKSVILALPDFEELLEDLSDLAALVERRDESMVSHDDVIKELKQNGLLPD